MVYVDNRVRYGRPIFLRLSIMTEKSCSWGVVMGLHGRIAFPRAQLHVICSAEIVPQCSSATLEILLENAVNGGPKHQPTILAVS